MIDATRIQDNLPVMMKIVSESEANSTAGLVTHNSNPRNHCVKVYDCFNHPEDATRKLLVLPFLRDWHNPDFDTVGEVIDFCRQLFEGVKFLHGKGLAHRLVFSDPVYEFECMLIYLYLLKEIYMRMC
jgi:serine/threonine protein kinase